MRGWSTIRFKMLGGDPSFINRRMPEDSPPAPWRWGIALIFGAGFVLSIGCSTFAPKHEVLHAAGRDIAEQSSPLLSQALRHYQSGHIDVAAQKYEQALAIDPRLGTAHNNLGLIRYHQRQLVPAAEHFDRAIQLLPGDPRPLNNLGQTLEAGGRVMEAIELYAEASDLEPDNPLYLGNWLRARIRMGEFSEELIALLEQLAFIETRDDWLSWTDEQLAIFRNPVLDRGPAPPNKVNQKKSTSGFKGGAAVSPHPATDLPETATPLNIPMAPSVREEPVPADEPVESLPVPAPTSIWERIDELQ
jgi:tetratricopeptide (TPR) repeat protein